MIVHYLANDRSGELVLPPSYVEQGTAGHPAELAVTLHRENQPEASSTDVMRVHLLDVDKQAQGEFEVRRELRPVFMAAALAAGN